MKFLITSTVYDRKGHVLVIAENSFIKTHPKQKEYANIVNLPEKEFLHSEVLCFIRALKVGKPYKIKVERYNKKGDPLLAKPCPICELAIKEVGIKIVEFTL